MIRQKISYRLATASDIDEVEQMMENAKLTMENQGIHQWDDIYPLREDYEMDMNAGTLYVGTFDGEIVVTFSLNQDTDEEYEKGKWEDPSKSYFVIHRLCVNPKFQNKGAGKLAMKYIEDKLKEDNIEAIRLDVFSENPFALSLYRNMGFKEVGFADWRKGRFLLMEKYL